MEYTKYPLVHKTFLVKGFTSGFHIGHFQDPIDVNLTTPKLSPELEIILQNKVDKEVTAGRIKGPFLKSPFPTLQVSPVTIRENQFRVHID